MKRCMSDTEAILSWMGILSGITIFACVTGRLWLAFLPFGFSLVITITSMRLE